MNYYQINLIKLAVKLAESSKLTVDEVMEIIYCNEDDAQKLMHELTLIGLATWNPVYKGTIDRNPAFV